MRAARLVASARPESREVAFVVGHRGRRGREPADRWRCTPSAQRRTIRAERVRAECTAVDREKRFDDIGVVEGYLNAESLQRAELLETSKHTGVALTEGHHGLS